METNKIRKTIINTLATTGASVVLMAVFARIALYAEYPELILSPETKFWGVFPVSTLLEIFMVNIVIHLGLFFIWKFESKYALLEYLIDFAYITLVLMGLGEVFKWYDDDFWPADFVGVPRWLPIVMAVVIYIFGLLTEMAKVRKDTEAINRLLKKRKKNNTDIVT